MTRTSKLLHIYERWAAALFLVVVLVLPRVSPVLVEFIPGAQSMVICTGDAYITVTLGPDGNPIEVSETQENHCTLSDIVQTSSMPEPFWHQLARSYQRPFSIREHSATHSDRIARLEPSRAPPALI